MAACNGQPSFVYAVCTCAAFDMVIDDVGAPCF